MVLMLVPPGGLGGSGQEVQACVGCFQGPGTLYHYDSMMMKMKMKMMVMTMMMMTMMTMMMIKMVMMMMIKKIL